MIGQVLHLKREQDYCKDRYAVVIVLEDCVIVTSHTILPSAYLSSCQGMLTKVLQV